ncbi:MAG: FGGY-family carbohydrate kinase, partial [Ardenticatenaceae bacterium]
MSELLLGIDIGTSSSKGMLARPNGQVVASATRSHDLSLPRPGWAEHDAETVWWADFKSLCGELLQSAGAPIAAICVSGIGPCLLPADAAGQPLRPAILYGIDTRATREIAELTERYGAERILARGGSLLTSQAVGPKLAWLRRNEPAVWAQTRFMFMASSFIVHRLTGEYVLDHHSASQCDPLYDLKENRWIEEWAAEVAPGLSLPRLLWPAEVAGSVTEASAEITGIPAGTPVLAGTIDAWAEAASVGVLEPGDLMLMYGTTMFLVEVVQKSQPHPGLWGTAGLFPGTYSLAAGMATSGALTAWLKEITGNLSYETLVQEAAEVPAGADGLVVLPYFAGERTPIFDPQARGVICGLTLRHGRGHLYRALLEATGYGVRHIFEAMRDAGGGGK